MQRQLAKYFRPYPLAEAQSSLQQWLATPSGQYLLGKEREILSCLPGMHGYHLMEVGLSPEGSLLEQFDNLHRFTLGPTASEANTGAVAELTALPLPSDTIETVIAHHVLEFSPKPHMVLNEIARVVAPGGHIVLFVLNPFSVQGLLKWPAALFRKSPHYRHHSLRLGRAIDWLRLLSFKPVVVKRGGFGPLQEQSDDSWLRRWGYGLGLPGGAFYTIVARKQVAKVIPPKADLLKNLKVPNLAWQQHTVPMPEHRTAVVESYEES
ncbi:methyltransferase domain-containing protein [Porticoccus sp. W117]|uniref:class I SAM-dependent methyltransferase n=1 Tax=Porticoccus sp. W117 TaxID=3054777 RepID=UPI00259A95E9|nr:methyltransferase domain-containing protein [Porticoccus sp. W117]MDM3871185.1 methyltransferase domain-containing protein [Porticoccus sp. W117]